MMLNRIGAAPPYMNMSVKHNGGVNKTDDPSVSGTESSDASYGYYRTNAADDKGANATGSENLKDQREQAVVRELVNIEKKVIAHEQAHMSAGSGVTGAASYSYSVGPDGKRYISGGEVSINVPATDDPEKGKALMQKVIQAALAPADPSPQDLRVAQSAQAKLLTLNQEIRAKSSIGKAYGFDANKAKSDSQIDKRG